MKLGLFLGNAGRNSGGPEVYETELVRALASIDKDNEYHVYCLDRRAPGIVGVRQENFHYHCLWPSIRPISMTLSLPLVTARFRTQSLHATFMPPAVPLQPYVLTLVCYSMFQHPEFYPAPIRIRVQALTHLGVRTARMFLCVSDDVRQRFSERFRIPEERMVVSHMAASARFRPLDRAEAKHELQRRFGVPDLPYFLFSGRWEHRKNIVRILRAFALMKRETGLPHKLVLTGSRTWAATEAEEAIVQERLMNDIVDLGKTPFEDLPLLYAGAEALVYPSLWEGFGMPLAEAMACGTPAITSDNSSMPEVAGKAALLVDPYSVENIADAMRRIGESAKLRESLSQQALQRSKAFSWEATARKSLESYRRLTEAA